MELLDDREQIELYLSCQNLRNTDFVGKSDPHVKLFVQQNGQWITHGKTDKIKESLNPEFKKAIPIEFIFEVQQPIRLEVWDCDSGPDDLIGFAETSVGSVMGSRKQTLVLKLNSSKNKESGTVTIKAEKSGKSHNKIFWQWSGAKIMNTGSCFVQTNPFLKFLKIRTGDELLVQKTKAMKKNLNPIWDMEEIEDYKLCSGDYNKPFRIECWDEKSNGNHKLIGFCEANINRILGGEKEFQLQSPHSSQPGTLHLDKFSMKEVHSFIDYLRGGEQISLTIAIDYTGSNGASSLPTSLHARNSSNQYEKAITAVGQILIAYDYDQLVPVYGFGGRPGFPNFTKDSVSHCFPCTGDVQTPHVLGVQGVLECYWNSLQHVMLSGPTYFAPLITEAAKACQVNKQNETDVYTVLLILTDGAIHDMEETIKLVKEAECLPLSIVIVGVGNADFSQMEILDGDRDPTKTKDRLLGRDFVQFVPFNKFNGDRSLLAKHVLAEIPRQLVEYKQMINRKPRPALI